MEKNNQKEEKFDQQGQILLRRGEDEYLCCLLDSIFVREVSQVGEKLDVTIADAAQSFIKTSFTSEGSKCFQLGRVGGWCRGL